MDWIDLLMPAVFSLMILQFGIMALVVLRSKRKHGLVTVCSRCSYDLSGQTPEADEVCPECGRSLERWGVQRVINSERGKGKSGRDHHRMMWIGCVWTGVALCFFGFMFLKSSPPYPFLHSETHELTLAQTPAGLGTVMVESHAEWVSDTEVSVPLDAHPVLYPPNVVSYPAPEPILTDRFLERSCVVTSSVVGSSALDLGREGLTFEDVVSWVMSLDPSTPERDANRIALVLYQVSPEYKAHEARLQAEFPWFFAPASMQRYSTMDFVKNGLRTSVLQGAFSHRAALGARSWEHAEARHGWRLAVLVFIVLGVPTMLVVTPWLSLRSARKNYERWREELTQGAAHADAG